METPAGLGEKCIPGFGKPRTTTRLGAGWGLEEGAADPEEKSLGRLHRSGSH